MTDITIEQAAAYYRQAGGPRNRVVAWLSVAIAESSLSTDAQSPTGAVGLYQIEPYSWPYGSQTFALAIDPETNTKAMLVLSGGGVNFAPWDTAYANINVSGRYTFLNWPEVESAAWKNMPYVQQVLQTGGGTTMLPPAEPGISGTLPDALSWFADVTNHSVPHLINESMSVAARYRRLYR